MTPLVTGAMADDVRAVVGEIATALRDPAVLDVDPGLGSSDVGRGSSGIAILYAELHAESGEQADADTALAFLDRALEKAADENPTALLYPGTVGVGWTLAYLEGTLVDPDPDDNDVDALVAQALAASTWPSPDLIRGVVGTGVYLLERERPADAVVRRLEAMAEEKPDGVTWFVPPEICLPDRRAMFPQGYYDVGMAHGQAGMVALLAHLAKAGTDGAEQLLQRSVDWLLAQRLPDDAGSRYPGLVDATGRPPSGTRLAWCYGDPGVAVALLAAADALKDDALRDEALDLALSCAARGEHESGIVDAPLCHGSVGLAHVFHRLYRGLGDERLADAARHWVERTLAWRHPGEPVGGYGSMRPPDEGEGLEYQPSGGFLEGAAGVGLALLAAVSEHAPDWDLLLLTKPVL